MTTTSRTTHHLRLRSLDVLRFVAALSVAFFHFTARNHSRWGGGLLPHDVFPQFSQISRYGYLGIHLFFVISGFVILLSSQGRTATEFVASRVSRLYPAYWFAVLFTASLRYILPSFGARSPFEVAVNLTMFQEPFGVQAVDGVYWTLWVEIQFYLLLLIAIRARLSVDAIARIFLLTATLAVALRQVWPIGGNPWTIIDWVPLFAAGVWLYSIHHGGHSWERWAGATWVTGLSAYMAATKHSQSIDVIASGSPTSPLIMAAGAVVVIALVGVACLYPPVRNLDIRAFTLVGALTYPFYLTHEYLGWGVIDWLSPSWNRWFVVLVALIICSAVAAFIYRLVEPPLRTPIRRGLILLLSRRSP